MKVKPFLKWVGGKGQLLSQFKSLYPKQFNNYFEPFTGGGAVFFGLETTNACINDLNLTLINAYRQIQAEPNTLIKEIKEIEKEYLNLKDRKEYYYKKREEFNSLPEETLKRAVLLIFLNRTCFNGMYRVNSKGEFNVPHGKYKNPKICDEENLRSVSDKLRNVKLTSLDFEKSVANAKEGDFIYFDPPYYPLNRTSNFTSYTKGDFLEGEQIRLAKTFKELDARGCYIMLSNSYTDFIRKLYKGFNQHEVHARRSINSNASNRGAISEFVITNY